MADWPANGVTDWNTKMLAWVTVEHNEDGTHGDITYDEVVADDIIVKSPWKDVRAYGAVGDGATDNTVAIQAAIDAAAVLGGKVFFPPGVWLITAKLDVPGNITLEGATLSGIQTESTASTIMLSGDIVGIDIANTSFGTIIKNLCITNSVQQGTGIYIHGHSRKIVISGCHIYNLDNGIMISGAWTINIQDMCWIHLNNRGVNIYHRTDEGETTTINIIGNTIHNNDIYNISVGEYSQAFGEDGVQCASLSIQNNMMGDEIGNYIAGVKSLTFENNHGESFGDKWVEFGYYVYNASIKNNLCTNGNYAFYFEGGLHRDITIENNDISAINQYAIFVKDIIADTPIRIINNRYYNVEGKVCYSYNPTTNILAEHLYMNGDDYDNIVAGHITELSKSIPTTGRYKEGSVSLNISPTAGGIVGWIFETNNRWGRYQSTEDTDTVNAIIAGSVVTPTDFTKYKQGDYIQIDGADTAGGDLLTVITDMDFDAETFTVYPVIVTAVTGETVTLIAGTWQAFGSLAGFSTLDNTGTPSVKNGTKFLTGGTTPITDFDDGYEGQVFTLSSEHIVKITDGTNIFLNGSTDFDTNPTDTLTLVCKADNKWYETSRSDNT